MFTKYEIIFFSSFLNNKYILYKYTFFFDFEISLENDNRKKELF